MQKEGNLAAKGWYRTLKVFYILANILGILLVIFLAYALAYSNPFLFLLIGTLIVLLLLRLVRSIFLYIYDATPFWKSFLPKAWLITIGVIILLTILAAVGNMESSSSPAAVGSNTDTNYQGYTLQQLQQMGAQPVQSNENQAGTSNPASQYATYTNVRFSYSICYPSSIFIPQGESANGDGQKFISNDGQATVLVYGSNAVAGVNQTLQQDFNLDEQYYQNQNPPATITAQSSNQNSFTISAQSPTEFFYEKTLMHTDAYTPQYYDFKTFQIEYSKQSAATYAPIASTMTQCFANTQ